MANTSEVKESKYSQKLRRRKNWARRIGSSAFYTTTTRHDGKLVEHQLPKASVAFVDVEE